MRILVLGGDGYLGWPTAMYLSGHGHDVGVLDNAARRAYDHELGSGSLVPIETLQNRARAWREISGKAISLYHGDLLDAEFTYHAIREFEPDAIVHFAEQRAAPYSMIDRKHAVYTQTNNVIGNLNVMFAIGEINRDIHLVKLGTMGEYGTPNIDIEEGWLDVTHKGRTDRMLFPKRPGSFYHLSKVHDSHNLEFGCRIWNLRVTDLNQGIVYGQETTESALDPRLATRFDYDAVFGTVLNRFAIQAVLGLPMSVYGGGTQTRAVINIRDTVECVRLACETPADAGEFRVFNQATESFSLAEMAKIVANTYPGQVDVEYIENPRVEIENHHYNFVHTALEGLGLKPHLLSDTLLNSMFGIIKEHRDRVDVEALKPTINWRKTASDLPGLDLVNAGPGDGYAPRGLRVLVTGASGFVGQHVVSQLNAAGHVVTSADLRVGAEPVARAVSGDLCDPRVREQAVTTDIDAVIHLAAMTSVLGSIQEPAAVHRTNVDITAGLLELCRQRGVAAFVLASTNAVVGDIGESTITEDLPLAPLTPYGGTKAAAEMLAYGYAGSFGLRAPVIRLTNVYGPGMAHKDSFVPRLMRAAASGGGVQIYGDGTQRRDLVHVHDAARALLLALTGWPTGPVIIGGSRSYTVNEITQVARDVSGYPIPAETIAAKPGEMPAVVVDIARARSRGFEPSLSLVDGMRGVWAEFAPAHSGQGLVDARD